MLQNQKLFQLVMSGIMALLFVNFYLKNKELSLQNSYGMVSVLTAAQDIAPHTLLTPNLLNTKQVPLKFLEPGAIMIKVPEQIYSRVQGKVTVTGVPSGGQILQANLSDPSIKDTGVAPLLPPGKRGYLLRLGNMDVAELILPGNHIDVMATFTVRQKDSSASRATYTILQNILVVGVGKELKKSNQDVTGKKEGSEGLILTLALESEEAERLSLAQAESQGEITVVVRPHGDESIKALPGVTPSGLLGH